MDPKLLAAVISNNKSDIEAIVNTIGVSNLISLMPHIIAILQTVQEAQKPAAAS